jgi:3-oxoacyl-[acyl-carrier-protein] synthase-3
MEIKNAYITSIGSYLPGAPVDNEEIESVLGMIGDKPSRLRTRILKNNGIKTRHYALDRAQRSTHQNCDLATQAVRNCIDASPIDIADIDMLAVATTQGDLPLPGLASMVQADAGIPACEIMTAHGVCSAGMMALKAAVNNVRLGDKEHAVACASELASRLLKNSRYDAADGDAVDFESEFLRWMLSDGAGAVLIEQKPRERGLSLRVDWIEIFSFASDFDLCMSCGTADQKDWALKDDALNVGSRARLHGGAVQESNVAVMEKQRMKERSWQDYPTYAEAEKAGALLIRQNLRLLDNIVKVGVDGFIRLIQAGKIKPEEIDHFLCHYSSHFFRGKILDLFKLCGCMVPEDRWFTNLYDKGNTGCASIFIMLDELFHSGKLSPGQTVFCAIPESGRFTTAYMKLTVVEGRNHA